MRRQCFRKNEDGATAIIVALFLTVLAMMFAISANLALAYLDKERHQASLDIAALIAVADGQADDDSIMHVLEAHNIRLKRDQITPSTGVYTPDPAIPIEDRFRPQAEGWNAIRLEIEVPIKERVFANILDNTNSFTVRSMATSRKTAEAWIGSRLLRLEGGLTGELLNTLLGYEERITVADYEGLAGVDIDILPFLDASNTSASLDVLTFQEVLDADVTVSEIMLAVEAITGERFASYNVGSGSPLLSETISLGEIMSLGETASYMLGVDLDRGDFHASAAELLMASLMLANGERQIELGADLLSGVASVSLSVGDKGSLMRWDYDAAQYDQLSTGQIYLDVALLGSTIRARVALAEASARLDAIKCDVDRKAQSAQVELTTSAAEIELLIGSRSVLSIDLSDDDAETLTFNAREIRNKTVKTGRSGLSVDVNGRPLLYRPILGAVDQLLQDLGLHVGEADVRVSAIDCSRPYLVR